VCPAVLRRNGVRKHTNEPPQPPGGYALAPVKIATPVPILETPRSRRSRAVGL
jgi:hypothetical protein